MWGIRLILVFAFMIFFCPFSFAHLDEGEKKGGSAVCKFTGGSQDFARKVVAKENNALVDEEGELEFEIESDREDRTYSIEVELTGVNVEALGKGVPLNEDTIDASLKISDDLEGFGIVSLSQDENKNPVSSNVKLKIKSLKKNKVSGTVSVTFPRTVVISAGAFDELEEVEDGELELTDTEENGEITATCKFKNIPFTFFQ